MALRIEVIVGLDDECENILETLPAVFAVCDDCEGHGYVLNESMRHHCYTAEEFNDAFDDEDDRDAYFSRGGKYDVQCPACRGQRVVLTVDHAACTEGVNADILARHDVFMDDLDEQRREDAQTYRMECGMY